ncbi:MAG: PilZ domain-containing protein [Candidatus Binatia bacterium]
MATGGEDRRSNARYPIPLPLRFRVSERKDEWRSRALDLAEGGLSFFSPYWLSEGTLLSLTFPLQAERFTLTGAVAYCRESKPGGSFRVGLYFVRPTLGFRLKLADEITAIRELRKELHLARGEEVSLEEAAREWVEYSAGQRPDLYDTESGGS